MANTKPRSNGLKIVLNFLPAALTAELMPGTLFEKSDALTARCRYLKNGTATLCQMMGKHEVHPRPTPPGACLTNKF